MTVYVLAKAPPARRPFSDFEPHPVCMEMDLPLQQPLDQDSKLRLIQTLFNEKVTVDGLSEYGSYLEYYQAEISQLRFGLKEKWRLDSLPVQTHIDLQRLIDWLSKNRDFDLHSLRDHMRAALHLPEASDQDYQECIQLAIRLWLTINFRCETPGAIMVCIPSIAWPGPGMQNSFHM